MPAEQLTGRERAILITLMAEARGLTNRELAAVGGFRLDGASRRKLNDQKLVDSTKVGRSLVHELTDDGWKWCRAELTRPRPARSGSFGGALYAVLAMIDRGLVRRDEQLSDISRPAVEQEIRAAYRNLADAPGEWIALSRLRPRLADIPRAHLDSELERMTLTPGVHLQQEPNLKALSDQDRAAAVRIDGEDRHMLMIEA